MGRHRTLLLFLALFAASLSASQSISGGGDIDDGEKIYVVYLGHLASSGNPSEPETLSTATVEVAHHDLLSKVLDDGSYASDRILRSYKRSLNGFAARLTEQQANKLADMEGIVSVFPSKTYELQTTRSWDFLGLPETPQEELPLEGEVIVGVLDTGIWLDSPSFSDEGFGPPPSRWKGICQNFTCNNKVIGARAYHDGLTAGLSPLDDQGHGSHTASTAAGRAVGNVSFGGLAAGTARGAVPGARLAVYKVCWDSACREIDILAAFDDAVADGVDVISFSIATRFPSLYFKSAEAIGSFHAMRRGVVTSAAAGNSGLSGGRVCNVAPWMLSVAASTIDRRFVDKIVLGNGKTIVGSSINTFPPVNNTTLAFPVNGSCDPDDLAGVSYKGKILVCPQEGGFRTQAAGPALAGAAGAVVTGIAPDAAFTMPLPALVVTEGQFDEIMAYVNSTSNPVGTIERTHTTVNPRAPIAASFSSPGPNQVTPEILKPDLSAPGIDIIASWSMLAPPSDDPNDKRRVQYEINSGTSMACPHASGAAAYVKSHHRDWSPAMIMSALITTATPMNTPGNAGSNDLKYGAGQLNPARARDPGLVYDASERDYVAMLCAQGYNATQLALITGSNATACAADNGSSSTAGDLNYPSMAALVEPGKKFTLSFPRTVTNVGDDAAGAVYDVKVLSATAGGAGDRLAVAVAPSRLEFDAANGRKASFTVTVSGVVAEAGQVVSAAVVWSDGEHEVRSPVVVYTLDSDDNGFKQ
ncbi:subtilisin-like protease SBT4.3 [Setaria viridis]|uniref:subtilisin-like protease SBT4.3 n=1 Tax=Setaria viridis TaxID=4556 RepID=UPI00149379F0|nr:subtilisin-like protease SBT4.3 [Setaria viridis]